MAFLAMLKRQRSTKAGLKLKQARDEILRESSGLTLKIYIFFLPVDTSEGMEREDTVEAKSSGLALAQTAVGGDWWRFWHSYAGIVS